MPKKAISFSQAGHLEKVLRALVSSGWKIRSIPDNALVPRNGLRLILGWGSKEVRTRVFAYSVTTSGRSKPHERRVEITTTYISGLKRIPGVTDVVLGVDRLSGVYVGIDSRRLGMGGGSHNASSFFDLEGLSVAPGALLVNPRAVTHRGFSSGLEHHAFCDDSRLSDYLVNSRAIHTGDHSVEVRSNKRQLDDGRVRQILAGSYPAYGEDFVLTLTSASRDPNLRISKSLASAIERRDFSSIRGRKISPEELRRLLTVCDEIGVLGEQAVLAEERRRLKKLGMLDAAKAVRRVSIHSVSEGYDISSYEDDGVTPRFIEVKATIGQSTVVDLSAGEWKAASRLRDSYYLVRVTNVRIKPTFYFIRNPVRLESSGVVERIPTGWKVDLRQAMYP